MFKKNWDKYSKHIAIGIVVVSALIMGYIIYELSITKNKVAHTIVENSIYQSHDALKDFFLPISNQLQTTRKQFELKQMVEMDTLHVLTSFIPILMNYPQLKSLAVANEKGKEFDILKTDDPRIWKTRMIDPNSEEKLEYWKTYHFGDDNILKVDSSWTEEDFNDSKNRPWFEGAINSIEKQSLYWTSPYYISTTSKIGITVSTGWEGDIEESWKILAFDLSADYLDRFTTAIKPSENGQVMIVTGDEREVVGLPSKYDTLKSKDNSIIRLEDIPQKELLHILKQENNSTPINYKIDGVKWWGATKEFKLSDEQSYKVVVALPENDFLAEVNESQRLMAGGFLGILVLSILILRSYNKQRKNSQLLLASHDEISHQNQVIEKKNEEIMDSIKYASKIQNAILPSKDLIKKHLPDSFLIYLPKDVVAGDFYWLETVDDLVLFAAADCTGHGVPGAMVSVMCNNALNRSVREYGLTNPAKILDKSREIIIQELHSNESKMSDGMDISLCVLNKKTLEMKWAGANNPLWILKPNNDDKVFETKPDKQPIGNFYEMTPFKEHTLQLEKGDEIVIFSDGYQDQFGGKKGKKMKPSRMRKIMLEVKDLPLDKQNKKLLKYFNDWKSTEEQVDDVCVIGVRL